MFFLSFLKLKTYIIFCMDDYKKLINEIENLKKTTKYFYIGKTSLNKNITCFILGNNSSNKKIVVQAGIHAREYITSFLIIKIIKYLKNFDFDGQIFFVPLLNPDGVDICVNGEKNIKNKKKKKFVSMMLKYFDKHRFKANVNGVDLNTNFDVCWGGGKLNNRVTPGAENFIGFKPNSENETKAIISLTKKINPFLTLSYHSKGEVIYWGFKNQNRKTKIEQKKYLTTLIKQTKYKKIFTKNSCGGYKDYCIMKLGIVGFTIEVGNDKLSHPIKLNNLQSIFDKNKNVILSLLK